MSKKSNAHTKILELNLSEIHSKFSNTVSLFLRILLHRFQVLANRNLRAIREYPDLCLVRKIQLESKAFTLTSS